MEEKKLTIVELVQTEKWKKFTSTLEIVNAILLGIIALMIVTGLTHTRGYGSLFMITVNLISMTCFLIGFQKFASESKLLAQLFYKIYGFGLSIAFLTLIFFKNHWSFPYVSMAVISSAMITISLILGIRETIGKNVNNINWKYFLRIAVALILTIYLILHNSI